MGSLSLLGSQPRKITNYTVVSERSQIGIDLVSVMVNDYRLSIIYNTSTMYSEDTVSSGYTVGIISIRDNTLVSVGDTCLNQGHCPICSLSQRSVFHFISLFTKCRVSTLIDLMLSLATFGLRVFIEITNKHLSSLNFVKIVGITNPFYVSRFSFSGYIIPAKGWCSLCRMFHLVGVRGSVHYIHFGVERGC
jgi:hypothetical protein